MGSLDKTIRVIIAGVIAVLYYIEAVSETLSVVLLLIAVLLALTSTLSFCPLYMLFGINSYQKLNTPQLY